MRTKDEAYSLALSEFLKHVADPDLLAGHAEDAYDQFRELTDTLTTKQISLFTSLLMSMRLDRESMED